MTSESYSTADAGRYRPMRQGVWRDEWRAEFKAGQNALNREHEIWKTVKDWRTELIPADEALRIIDRILDGEEAK